MPFDAQKPIIVQSDRTILVATDTAAYEDARDVLASFAELVKSPEMIHTYRITPLSLWNAAATGSSAEKIVDDLRRLSAFPIPQNVEADIREYVGQYGRLRLLRDDAGDLILVSDDAHLITEILSTPSTAHFIIGAVDPLHVRIKPDARGELKQALIKIGRPVQDLAGYLAGAHLDVELREKGLSGHPFSLRDYQEDSVRIFYAGGSEHGGSGVICLPCGAGKTVVGIGAIAALQTQTLILTANNVSVRQWRSEIIDKTTVSPNDIGEYTGDNKEIRPITVATYQILTHRASRDAQFKHLPLFSERDWGLIIYDEVHMLPAPVFRATADIQARRRLGLTATLVREDGHEDDVFALIGPKKYDAPWRDLERRGWIAPARCIEMRVPFQDESYRYSYSAMRRRDKFRVAATNPEKLRVAKELATKHAHDHVLIIGQYLDQLELASRELDAPLITGRTPQKTRYELYDKFKRGEIPRLVVSKVANFAIDLPDANVAIQLSGTFGSRQEEAQRLGRVLRPKENAGTAMFYTLVTRDTVELEFAAKRQLFLTEQGYRYEIEATGST